MADTKIESGLVNAPLTPNAIITVNQPQKLENLLETITLLNTVSERLGESKAGDLGGGGSTAGGQQGDDQASPRDIALQNLPAPAAMQQQLAKHIQAEIKTLHLELKRVSRLGTKAGAAYRINQLYAKIRRLNSLLSEIVRASVEVLQRLYIRIFIDKQEVL